MGICASDPETEQSRKIDTDLTKDKKYLQEEIKLLLLGTGESGKSTIFKQMKILSVEGGFKEEEKQMWKRIIITNTMTQMKIIITAANKLGMELRRPENRVHAQRLSLLDANPNNWSPEVGRMIKELWADETIQEVYENHKDKFFQLDDSAAYLFANVDRFVSPNYVPTNDDVLRARSRTSGIEEATFDFVDMTFRMIDVGGQRSERRKWIHCFDCVTAVIFCVALSEYDQYLREDITQNRMKESLLLFDEICNSPWFKKVPFIIFLNKRSLYLFLLHFDLSQTDLFEEKIKRVPLKVCFQEYNGNRDPLVARQYISERFKELNTSPKQIYTHFTCAIDTQQMDFVFAAVRKELLNNVLDRTGIISSSGARGV